MYKYPANTKHNNLFTIHQMHIAYKTLEQILFMSEQL